MLAIVLHGAVSKMNQPLFPVLAGFDHHLLAGPRTFAGHITRHVGFAEGHNLI